MRLKQESSKIIKPLYEGVPPSTTEYVRLNVFDKVVVGINNAIIYAYRPPNPTNFAIENGLRKALSVYREWAGRLSKDGDGEPIILLNDAGVRFVEASADTEIDQVIPHIKPFASCSNFHPNTQGFVEELVQIQVTRFACGSIMVGFTGNHFIADGHAASNFLIAWGQACRGLEIHPPPRRNRDIFKSRDPPRIEYEHRGVEFKNSPKFEDFGSLKNEDVDPIVADKVHFSLGFLAKLKAKATSSHIGNVNNRPFSTFESLMAHLWRAVTKARGLSLYQTCSLRVAVNGRMRMNPRIPNEYFGNLVLWAFPTTKVKDLLYEPPSYGAKLIRDAIGKVDDGYFRSFIDFASYKVKEENLVPTIDLNEHVECPNLEVSSWLKFPFHELDFGGGRPCFATPSYNIDEGIIFLLSSSIGDGSIDVHISLFENHMAVFKQICYDLGY